MIKLISIVLITFSLNGWSQDKPAYVLYNSSGKKVSYKKMIKDLSNTEVSFCLPF